MHAAGNLARSDIIAAVLFANRIRLRCSSGMQQHFGVIAFEHTLGARTRPPPLGAFFGRGLLRNIARVLPQLNSKRDLQRECNGIV